MVDLWQEVNAPTDTAENNLLHKGYPRDVTPCGEDTGSTRFVRSSSLSAQFVDTCPECFGDGGDEPGSEEGAEEGAEEDEPEAEEEPEEVTSETRKHKDKEHPADVMG